MTPVGRVLHLLSQRPGLTGSGITLQALVREAARAGWEQCVAVGLPAQAEPPRFEGMSPDEIHPLRFGSTRSATSMKLDLLLPGMSDVMPYPSTRFSALTPEQVSSYRAAWHQHVSMLVDSFRPDVIHSHHVWILSALVKDAAPDVPVVSHCHATGLRQMALCPHLAEEVRRGCARNDLFAVLHDGHASELARELSLERERIHVVGAGYRRDVFHTRGRPSPCGPRLLYAGKLARAKGLPWLLDAYRHLQKRVPGLELHVVGGGAGDEAEALRARMAKMTGVLVHGRLEQDDLAELMRQCAVFVLPSFYEGLPLVLVEALACGCRLVATDLPGIAGTLAPLVGEALERVALPRLHGVDRPLAKDLPAFRLALEEAISRSLERGPIDAGSVAPRALQSFTWKEVFSRIETIWRLATRARPCRTRQPPSPDDKPPDEEIEES